MVLFVLDRPLDILRLCDNERIVHVRRFEIGQNFLSLFNMTVCNQPTRALGQPRYSSKEDKDENELESEWKAPCNASA
jgi:hypothetical protein